MLPPNCNQLLSLLDTVDPSGFMYISKIYYKPDTLFLMLDNDWLLYANVFYCLQHAIAIILNGFTCFCVTEVPSARHI